MSERKVLNKYYPPDFDPAKIPKLHLAKNRQYSIRIMAPCNMRCNTCGEYIYKGKKFNSRKETVEDEDYLGLRIFRFYIKCPRCVSEIAFKTDLVNTDYTLEAGATRNFEATRTAEKLADEANKAKEAEEANNPMKVLENRTKQSQQEMGMLETLEELRELKASHGRVDMKDLIDMHQQLQEKERLEQENQDEEFVKSVFGTKRLKTLEESDDDDDPPSAKAVKMTKQPSIALPVFKKSENEKRPLGNLKSKLGGGLIVVKTKTVHQQRDSQESPQTQHEDTDRHPGNQNTSTDNSTAGDTADSCPSQNKDTSGTNGLNLLAMYSDSSEDSS